MAEEAKTTHVWVGSTEEVIYREMSDGYHYLYFQQATGEVVRLKRAVILGSRGKTVLVTAERVIMTNTWQELLAKYQAHPANWQNKANVRMMALYQAKREEEARKRLEVVK